VGATRETFPNRCRNFQHCCARARCRISGTSGAIILRDLLDVLRQPLRAGWR
jgi:hypothetical protein